MAETVANAAGAPPVEPKILFLPQNGWIPNNPRLPVLLYRTDLAATPDLAHHFETLFRETGWPPQWRNGIFPFHHYHAASHEVLGIAAGTAQVMLGGLGGPVVGLSAGDVTVLPVGTGHCLLVASPDFLVVGAYPPGQDGTYQTSKPTPAQIEMMEQLPFPASDPLSGAQGPLPRLWHKARPH
ncbi:hypothetical protein [Beijerinckia mobilis]|uniref:hypothetical protein n=1 Tax=Beijerinckia mobilis TaxID=231434 RepID=UPI00068FC369|nr:hypothetical protein [Beijerinckia mobilis]